MKIIFTKSFLDTGYPCSPENSEFGDTVDIKIDVYDNLINKFIPLYFDIQNNLKNIMDNSINILNNLIAEYNPEDYHLYNIMEEINNIFYPPINGVNQLFPFEVAVFLIRNGYKRYFLNDSYYLALLYETPEIYNRIIEDEFFRNNHDNTQDLIHLHNDKIIISNENIDKYKKYTVSPYTAKTKIKNKIKLINNFDENKIIYYNIRSYNHIITNLNSYILKIIKIPGVCICGGYVNKLINDRLINEDEYDMNGDIDIFFYGDNSSLDILIKIYNIIKIVYNIASTVYMNISHSKNSITIICSSTYCYKTIKFQIIKRIYKNISHILLGFDLDSSACSLYVDKGEILISYLPRYKFSLENRLNIINPYRQSSTYNDRLIKYTKRGYSIFIPGAIHLEETYIDAYKKYSYHTLQNLLCKMVKNSLYFIDYNYKLRKHKSDYDCLKNSKYIFNIEKKSNKYNKEEHDKWVIAYLQKRLKLNFNSVTDVDNFLLDMVDKEKDNFTFSNIVDNPLSIKFNNIKYIYDVLFKTGVHLHWNTQNPDTQITGTFNPTYYNYLSNYNLIHSPENVLPNINKLYNTTQISINNFELENI